MHLSSPVSWRVARWAVAVKSALLLVLATPGFLLSTGAASAYPANSTTGFVFPDPADREQAVQCLSDAVYYEAGFEPLEGQRAVAQVILNRVRDSNFPETICGVVYQGWQRRTGCQFSFVCDGSLTRRPPTPAQAASARAVAEQALSEARDDAVGTATHYHAHYVDPYWAPTLDEITTIGSHTFYSWRGKAGELAALREPYRGGETRYWESVRVAGKNNAAKAFRSARLNRTRAS